MKHSVKIILKRGNWEKPKPTGKNGGTGLKPKQLGLTGKNKKFKGQIKILLNSPKY